MRRWVTSPALSYITSCDTSDTSWHGTRNLMAWPFYSFNLLDDYFVALYIVDFGEELPQS
jgi:hypothetical protein